MQNVNKVDLNDNKNGKRKRRRKRNLFGYYVLVIFLALSIGFSLSVTLLFNIKQIVIAGTTQYDTVDIIRASGVVKGDNLIRLNTKQARQKILDSMLYIDDAIIKKKFPDKLSIELIPSERYAYMECKGGYMVISKGWRILELISEIPDSSLITINGFDPVSNQVMTQATSSDESKDKILNDILTQIENQKLENIISIDLSNKHHIKINYENRINILIGNSSDIEYKLKYAYQLLNETKELGKNKNGYLIYHEDLGYSFITSQEYDEINKKLSQSATSETGDLSDGLQQQDGTSETTVSDDSEENTGTVTMAPYQTEGYENTTISQNDGINNYNSKNDQTTKKTTVSSN